MTDLAFVAMVIQPQWANFKEFYQMTDRLQVVAVLMGSRMRQTE